MPKVKHTGRKGLQCFRCGYLFNKSYNYRRHLCNTHGVDEYGEPSSTSERERYRRSARKVEQHSTSARPKLALEKQERKRGQGELTQPKRVRLIDQPSPYAEPAHEPKQPLPKQLVSTARQFAVHLTAVQPFASSLIFYSPTREEDLA